MQSYYKCVKRLNEVYPAPPWLSIRKQKYTISRTVEKHIMENSSNLNQISYGNNYLSGHYHEKLKTWLKVQWKYLQDMNQLNY
uniref:Uncharacterized protein n=1 Tax=Acrobeloides nanus TaxID=290746 RepID=A0A914EBJ7_9BILA